MMKLVPGTDVFVPDADTHFYKMGAAIVDYQRRRLNAAVVRVRRFGVAVDAGAHIGLITRQLAKRFARVVAVEPARTTFECLRRNTAGLDNVVCVRAALGDGHTKFGLESDGELAGNSGNRQVVLLGRKHVLQFTLDRLFDLLSMRDQRVDSVDLLKIDVQGWEHPVLAGASACLSAFSPVVLVETEPEGKLRRQYFKPHKVGKYMRRRGAVAVEDFGADKVYEFPPAGAAPFEKYVAKGDYHWRAYADHKASQWVDRVVEYVNSQNHSSVLDAGCGDGLYTSLMNNALGIDSDPTGINLAREHGVKCSVLSVYHARDLGRCFDAVCLFDVFEHLHKQDHALRVCASIAPVLHLLNPDPTGSSWHATEFTAQGLSEFVTSRGWKVAHTIRMEMSMRNKKTLFHLLRPGAPGQQVREN